MFKNKTIKDMIRDNQVFEISEYLNSEEAKSDGMVSMDSTIINLYKKDLITREVALDYAFDRKEMNKLI